LGTTPAWIRIRFFSSSSTSPETGQNVTVKVFQQDESFTDLNIQITAGLAEEVAEGLRSQWVDGLSLLCP